MKTFMPEQHTKQPSFVIFAGMKPEFLLAQTRPYADAESRRAVCGRDSRRRPLRTAPVVSRRGLFALRDVSALLLRSQLWHPRHALHGGIRRGTAPRHRRARCLTGYTRPTNSTVEGIPADRGRYASAEATVTAWRDPADGTWHPAGDRVTLHADSLTALHPGERLRCRGTVRPLRGGAESYRRLMTRRGFAGTMWLSERTILERLPARNTRPAPARRRTNGPDLDSPATRVPSAAP